MKYKEHVLAAIVTGTSTNISLMRVGKKHFDSVFHLDYNTKSITNFPDLLHHAISMAKENAGINVKTACIAAAGPVPPSRNEIQLTNVNLRISRPDILVRTTLKKVYILNDYEALAYGIGCINHETDLIKLPHIDSHITEGKSAENCYAVIGIKSGLGMAFAQYHNGKYVVVASEGGHIDFGSSNKEELELVKHFQKRRQKNPISYEAILSDEGMCRLFDFVAGIDNKESKTVNMIKKLKGQEKLSAIQASYHLNKASRKTMDMIVSFYARACRNLALLSECYSGLYIDEMDILRDLKRIKDKNRILMLFMEEFERHGKMSELLRQIPVYVISNKKTTIIGTCHYAMEF